MAGGKAKTRPFTGRCENQGVWAKHFLCVACSNSWETEATKIANAAVMFEQEAETWSNSRSAHWEHEGSTWAEFEMAFVARFHAPGYLEQLECALHDLKPAADESVASYTK